MVETHPRYLNAFMGSVPQVLDKRTCLYVGAWPGGTALIPELRAAGYELTIVEVWAPYVVDLQHEMLPHEKVVCSDIRTWEADSKYDLVIWWHGPEHMPIADWEATLEKLDGCARAWCVVAGPWGPYRQPPIDGNPQQEHVAVLEAKWFSARGWNVKTFGRHGIPGGEVVAWRHREKGNAT